jgi:hypothetical protein
LSTLSRYEPAMCEDGNPCARRRRARSQGARAGNLGHLRIECRDRGAAVGGYGSPLQARSRIEGRSASSSARVCAWRSAPRRAGGQDLGDDGKAGPGLFGSLVFILRQRAGVGRKGHAGRVAHIKRTSSGEAVGRADQIVQAPFQLPGLA